MGGAWAIAALAYGTETVAPVDVIAGPGNIWVTTAKRLVQGRVGIDMIAGPSEVLVLADDSANPEWLAADMLSQAEHDALASAICITDNEALAMPSSRNWNASQPPCPVPTSCANRWPTGAPWSSCRTWTPPSPSPTAWPRSTSKC